MARDRTALRHREPDEKAPTIIDLGALVIDDAARKVVLQGTVLHLTPKEYDLLLTRKAGRVLTHRQILSQIWGPAHADDVQYLRVLVAQLRSSVDIAPGQPSLIRNEPGVGYRLQAVGDEAE